MGREPTSLARSIGAAIAVTSGCVLPSFLVGALAVQIRADLVFDEAALGMLTAAFFGSAALSSAVLGRSVERIGPGVALRLTAIGSSALLLAIAVGARSWGTLVALLALAGVVNAGAQTAANAWLAAAVPRDRFGMAFGVKQAAIPAAMLLGGLAVPTIAVPLGWRWAFVTGAVVAFAAALSVPGHLVGSWRAGGATAPDRGAVHVPTLAMLAVGIGFGASAAGTLGSFSVSASVDAGISPSGAGLLFAGGAAVGLVARLVLGVRADRRGGGHLRVVAWLMGLGSIGYVLLATQEPAVIVVTTPALFAIGWGWPGLFHLAVVRTHPQAAGTATGITQTGTYIGAVAGPLLFGYIAAHGSYRAAWFVAAAASLAAGAAHVAGRRLLRARTAQAAAVT